MTTAAHEPGFRDALQNLVCLNHQAIEICTGARHRLRSGRARQQLDNYIADHEQHIRGLARHLSGMGHAVPEGPGNQYFLAASRAGLVAALSDGDILTVMTALANAMESTYAVMAERVEVTGALARTIQLTRDDEIRHRRRFHQGNMPAAFANKSPSPVAASDTAPDMNSARART